jgi:hypothetical protein
LAFAVLIVASPISQNDVRMIEDDVFAICVLYSV